MKTHKLTLLSKEKLLIWTKYRKTITIFSDDCRAALDWTRGINVGSFIKIANQYESNNSNGKIR